MTKDDAINETQEFLTKLNKMELHQVWTAMTFCLTAAMKMTPEDQLTEVIQQLFVMVDGLDERDVKRLH